MRKRRVRVPVEEGRVGFKKSKTKGMVDVAVVRGSDIMVFELPEDAVKQIQKQGYIELTEERKRV